MRREAGPSLRDQVQLLGSTLKWMTSADYDKVRFIGSSWGRHWSTTKKAYIDHKNVAVKNTK